MLTLDHGALLEHAARDGDEIGRLCLAAPEATVRSCPEWSGADLLAHTTAFAHWMPGVFAGTSTMTTPVPAVTPAEAAGDWADALDSLLTTLRAAAVDDPVPNWSTSPDTAIFWIRRCAQEFAVHRWDAATTGATDPAPIPGELARDGIEEYFDAFTATGLAMRPELAADATIALELTDLDLSISKDLPHPGPVTRMRGTASELLLALWHRVDPLDLHADGDRGLLERWPRI
ncbi:maleylpyruvate isomerase family mycothiol-dependent enzyme [Sciscionella marina]|uniref:maleylpyruvate isomerase family mycothiol-dependent enzyme n=1 Tax=Sciscionella marina TaxID=508770 RepID=UPI0003758DDF|nr:maleylpyruvate isomerase family mycothiol-dependent enzyme [Sciscionella marina]